jgi:chromosomal replication initiation ATPase DnaA
MQSHAPTTWITQHRRNQINLISETAADQLLRQLTENIAQAAFPVHPDAMVIPTRGRKRVGIVRRIAMYLCHVALGFSLTVVGRIFGRDRTTAAHACRSIEDARDNRTFDYTMDALETATRLTVWRRGASFGNQPV